MSKSFDPKSLLPHGLAILFFYALTFFYFKAELLDNKKIRQDDMLKYQGMVADQAEFYNKTGEVCMWNARMFGGMPGYLIFSKFDYGPITIIEKATYGFFADNGSAHLVFLPMLCTYLMLLCFGVRPLIAAGVAAGFSLTTYNLILIDVGHVTKLRAIGYCPLILGAMHLVLHRQKIWLGGALMALAMTLELRAAHPQITYYLAFVCAFYGLSEVFFAFQQKAFKEFGVHAAVLLISVGLGAATYAGHLLTTLEYTPYSTRGSAQLTPLAGEKKGAEGLDKDYAFGWSQGIGESFTLLIPGLYGGSSSEKLSDKSETYKMIASQGSPMQAEEMIASIPLYHGRQPFTAGPIYAGAILCFLFALGCVALEDRLRYWIIAGCIITLFFGWGDNFATFNYFLFDNLPGFNKFRSVSMALSITVLLVALLGGLALEWACEEKWDKVFQNKLLYAAAPTAGIALLVGLIGTGIVSVQNPEIDPRLGGILDAVLADRKYLLRHDSIRTFCLIAVSVGLLWAIMNQKLSKELGLLGIGLLMVGDLWLIGKRYLLATDFEENIAQKTAVASPADLKIKTDKALAYRVLTMNDPFQDASVSIHHRSVGGYFAAKMRRYQDLTERTLQTEIQGFGNMLNASKGDINKITFSGIPVLNMLNTRYFKFGDEENAVLQNPAALGAAWFVDSLRLVQNADEEIKALGQVNLRNYAILDASRFKAKQSVYSADSSRSVLIKEFASNKIVYESNNSADGFVVFSEIYYPEGWKAQIDGKDAEILGVNFVLRGMEIPKGKHTITFTFESDSYEKGAFYTLVSSYLVCVWVLVALAMVFWGTFKAKNDEPVA